MSDQSIPSPPPQDLAAFLSSLEPRIVGAGATGYVVVKMPTGSQVEIEDGEIIGLPRAVGRTHFIALGAIHGLAPRADGCYVAYLPTGIPECPVPTAEILCIGIPPQPIFCSSPEQFFADVLRARSAWPSLPSTEPLRECDNRKETPR